jgi:hypothetical protein
MMPIVSQPRWVAALATERITAFRPGQSPPPVTTPILLTIPSLLSRTVRADAANATIIAALILGFD